MSYSSYSRSSTRSYSTRTSSRSRGRGNHCSPGWMCVFLLYLFCKTRRASALHHMKRQPPRLEARDNSMPLIVTNYCGETIYPAVNTQAGDGPSSNGFKLDPGEQNNQTVSPDWQGRVWGRTNCSFNDQGTGPANGQGRACGSGDCGGIVDCKGAVSELKPSNILGSCL